jgi:hypothetical protein
MPFKHRGWYIHLLSKSEGLCTLPVTVRSTIFLSVLFGVLLLITSSSFFPIETSLLS